MHQESRNLAVKLLRQFEQPSDRLVIDVVRLDHALDRLPATANLTASQRAALISLAHHLGIEAVKPILQAITSGEDAAALVLALPGSKARRKAEAAAINKNVS